MKTDHKAVSVKKPVSIRRKLFIAFTGLIACIALFIFIYFPHEREQEYLRLTKSKAEAIAGIISTILADAAARADEAELQRELHEMAKMNDIVYIIVHGSDNSVLAAYNLEGGIDALYKSTDNKNYDVLGCTKVSVPLKHQDVTTGEVFLALSLAELSEEIAIIRMAILLFSIVTLAVGSIIVLFISTFITVPLKKLVETTKFITNGNLEKRVEITSGDEFETLGVSFNDMLDNLNTAQRQLSYLNKDLEKAVHERTGELQKEIHHHRQTATALRESESRFRTIFEKAGMGMIISDLAGKIIETNEAFAEWIGYSHEELKRMSFQELTHPEDLKNELLFYSENLLADQNFQPYESEKRYIHKSGKHIWGKLTVTFLRDRNLVPLLSFGMIEDRTQKRMNEEQMKKQTSLLKGVAESTNILLTEPDFASAMNNCLRLLGEATEVDRAYLFENFSDKITGALKTRQLFEWTNGTVSSEIDNPELQDLDFPEDIYESLTTGKVYKGDIKYVQGVMKEIMTEQGIVSLLIVPVYVRGAFWGFIGFDDCHRERRWSNGEESILKTAAAGIGGAIQREWFERELRSVTEKAIESDKLKSSLLSNMSHEFRTPINGILGFSELLMEELQDSKRHSMAKRINASSKRLMRTLVSILTYSELESNKIKPEIKIVKLIPLVESILYPAIGKASEKNLDFEFVHTDLSIAVKVDANLCAIIMDNILDNAVKFTKTGKISVSMKSDNSFAYILVTDTGDGIPWNKIDIVFQEFRQASEGMGRGYEGSGLGLTIARKLCRLMHGELEITSEEGKGTAVTIRFPLPGLREQESADRAFYKTADSQEESAEILTRTILLVEDNKTNADVIAAYLKKTGIVDTAISSADAILMAAKKHYDLILMDINLGQNMTGIDVAREIRRLEGYNDIPIIAVTGYAMAGDREKLIAEGFNEYIAKPFNKSELLETLQKFVA